MIFLCPHAQPPSKAHTYFYSRLAVSYFLACALSFFLSFLFPLSFSETMPLITELDCTRILLCKRCYIVSELAQNVVM